MNKEIINISLTWITAAFIVGLSVFLLGIIVTLPFWLLWNWLIPDIFGLPEITLLQAFGLWLFVVLLKSNNYIKNDPFNINKLELKEVEKKINNTEESPFSDTSFGQWYNEIKKKYEA